MAAYTEPLDYVDGQKIRASWLNRYVGQNLLWLKERSFDLITIQPGQATNFIITSGSSWVTLNESYRLRVLLPTQGHVLLALSGGFSGNGAGGFIYFDWVRDGNIWLSTGSTAPATLTNAGTGEIYAEIGVRTPQQFWWWDTDVEAGEHYYDLGLSVPTNSLIEQVTSTWQLWAMGW